MECNKKWYQKWIFWVIIILSIIEIIFIILAFNQKGKSIETSKQDTNADIAKQDEKEENKYQVINDYDGIYKFSFSSDNGYGHIFNYVGIVLFDNGVCKVKYDVCKEDEMQGREVEYDGVCGLNKADNSSFYFKLNSEAKYKCISESKNLKCELKSKYDLASGTNNNLDLTYVSDSTDFDSIFKQIKNEEYKKREEELKIKQQQEETEFKNSCKTYTFKEMARNPESFKGTNVKLTGEVIQTIYGTYSTQLRVNITKQGTYSTYYTDTIYVTYYPTEGENKILEDDIITIYGTSQGDTSYTSTMGATITLPHIYAKYISINE